MDDWSIPGLTDRTLYWLIGDKCLFPHWLFWFDSICFDLIWFVLFTCCEKGVSDGRGIFGILVLEPNVRKPQNWQEGSRESIPRGCFQTIFQNYVYPYLGKMMNRFDSYFTQLGDASTNLDLFCRVPVVYLEYACYSYLCAQHEHRMATMTPTTTLQII